MKKTGNNIENNKSVKAGREIDVRLVNDEPVDSDELGRTEAIASLVAAIKHCETPFVMAINGGWGSGKTSLLKCLEKEIKNHGGKKFRTVWFSPWKFQFEESPAVSLLQQIRHTAVEEKWVSIDKIKKETAKLLNIAGTLAGEIALKITTGHAISTRDILNQGAAFEEKYFEAKQLTSRMQEEFEKAIREILGIKDKNEDRRLVLFIDDLDRCRTENALRLLEALKLFLNAHNCVYVLAIDIDNLAKNLGKEEHSFKSPYEYLDKIFQLVYKLPAPDHNKKLELVRTLMKQQTDCSFDNEIMVRIEQDLAGFIGDNPRALKQFCNRFRLESAMLKKKIGKYDPVRHIFLQFLQSCFPTAYKLFGSGCCIKINRSAKKDFDKFIVKWSALLARDVSINRDSSAVFSDDFENYFQFLPASAVDRSALEEPYLFAAVCLRESRAAAIVCLEKHVRNTKIEPGINLSDMKDLSGTILRDLNLSNCLLDRCIFDGVDFERTDLSFSDCSYSSFKNARLMGVNAKHTNFSMSYLTGVSFEGANFEDAVFTGAELEDNFRKTIESLKEEEKPVNKSVENKDKE